MGKDALTVVSKVLTRVAAYAFDPAALVEAEHVVAYSVEISMVAIMGARPQCAYQRALCGLRGLLARGRKANTTPLRSRPLFARVSIRASISPHHSHRHLEKFHAHFTPTRRIRTTRLNIDLSYNFRGTLAEPRRIKGGEYPGEP